jgi:hypothetical protein
MTTLRTSAKDRSKSMHRVGETDGFEYGWESRGRTRASGNLFTVVGVGTIEEAIAWMARSEQRQPAKPAYRELLRCT